MSSMDRWLWMLKLIGAFFSAVTAILAFLKQTRTGWATKRKRKRKSPHRSAQ